MKKGIVSEFKSFISRGNVIDMAVGIIMGTAFTAIVNSLVKDLVMPFVGYLVNGVDFSGLKLVLNAASGDTPEVAVSYGSFIQQIINFIIIAFVAFIMVKIINKLRNKDDIKKEETPQTSQEIVLLTEIRDILKTQ